MRGELHNASQLVVLQLVACVTVCRGSARCGTAWHQEVVSFGCSIAHSAASEPLQFQKLRSMREVPAPVNSTCKSNSGLGPSPYYLLHSIASKLRQLIGQLSTEVETARNLLSPVQFFRVTDCSPKTHHTQIEKLGTFCECDVAAVPSGKEFLSPSHLQYAGRLGAEITNAIHSRTGLVGSRGCYDSC